MIKVWLSRYLYDKYPKSALRAQLGLFGQHSRGGKKRKFEGQGRGEKSKGLEARLSHERARSVETKRRRSPRIVRAGCTRRAHQRYVSMFDRLSHVGSMREVIPWQVRRFIPLLARLLPPFLSLSSFPLLLFPSERVNVSRLASLPPRPSNRCKLIRTCRPYA